MQNTGKSRKPLVIGIIAAVVILAVLLVLLLTQCTGGTGGATTAPGTTQDTSSEVPTYDLYWNADRALYSGKSEAGMSSRMPEDDGYFHVRFILDGEEVTLKVADRKLINSIDVKDLMGLEFDENGIVTGVIAVEDMPLEKVAWQFYVQSAGGKLIKANSSSSLNGMEVILEGNENTGIYDMSGKEGPIGTKVTPINKDRIYAIQNLAGELTHVFIYERPNYMLTHEGECEHCGKTVTWYEWVKDSEIPLTSGHYQLQNDITTKTQGSTEEDAKICLDLNGHRIDGPSGKRVYALFNVGSELAIMDTSEEKTGTLAAHGKGDQGMVVWVRYGAFYLYDGILDGSDATTTKNGTTVSLSSNTFMYMYGGELIGGNSTYTYNESTKKYSGGLGGTMSLSNKSKFVMNDGVIRDGFAEAKITARNTDGSPKTYQRGLGGNIFMSGGSVMEMNGGVIKNGKAGTTAGNIYMDGTSELTINGGSIQGGNGAGKGKNGGSVFVSTKAILYLKSGRITGGTSRNCGGNLYVNGTFIMSGGYIGGGVIRNFSTGKVSEDAAHRNLFVVNGTFRMYGGTIDGGVQATDSSATDNKKCFVGLTTYATIDGGEASNRNLTLSLGAGGPVQVNVGDLRDSAKIRVTATTGIFTTPTSENNVDNFYSDIEGAEILYHQGCIALGRMSCICGSDEHFGACDGTEVLWAPHISTTALPNREGYFYLINDVKSGTNYLRGDASIHTRLDLNGKTVTGPGGKSGRVYSLFENMETYDEEGNIIPNIEGVSMQLTVTDTVGGGKIVLAAHEDRDQGAMFWGRHEDSVITIYGGTFDGSASASARHGGVVISAAGDLNIYGGTFTGGTSTNGGIISMTKAGTTFTMSGGTITGGVATSSGGGNVYIAKGVTLNMSGGTIADGQAKNGGNIYMAAGAIMNLSGGTVTGGKVDNSAIEMDGGIGGNIYQNGTFTMTGGTISDGYVRGGTKGGGHGGNIGVYGTANLLGGTISGGNAASAGGNVGTISTSAQLVLDGVRLENGVAGGNGGNLGSHVRTCKSIEIKGDTVITGGKAVSGGNIAARASSANGQDLTVTITGGTIENGTATSYGGNIFVYNSTSGEKASETCLVIGDAAVSGGQAGSQGGNIFFEGNGNVTLTGANISGGTARQGGNLYMLNGDHVFTDSVITGGHARKEGDGAQGGNIYANKGTLELIGTTVENGQATADTASKYPTGGNIYVAGGVQITVDEKSVISGGKVISSVGAWSAGGNVYVYNGKMTVNGGTITGGEAYTQGNNIYTCKNGTFELNSGKVENTVAKNQNIYMEGGKLNIKGGEVVSTCENSRNIHGKADQDAVINISGGVVSGGSFSSGGNIYVNSGTTLNISGGEIKDGTATSSGGGNVYVAKDAVVNMTDGTVSGGKNQKSGSNGGSISIANGGIFNMSGGNVKNGTTVNGGGNFYVNGELNISDDAYITGGTKNGTAVTSGNVMVVNGTMNISGGVIDGDTVCTNSGSNGCKITLSGKPMINKGKSRGLYLSYYNSSSSGTATPATVYIDGTLEEGSKVVISSAKDTVLTTNATVQENRQYFQSLDPEKEIIWLEDDRDVNDDGESDLHKLIYGMTYCICGVDSEDPADHLGDCGGKLLSWVAWTRTDSLPTTTGNYYLTEDVTLNFTKDSDAAKEYNTSGTINIDLNGHTVSTEKDIRVFRVRNGSATTTTSIAVTDTSEAKTGRIVHNCTAGTLDGGIVWVTQAGHTFSLYGGTLDAFGLTSNTNATAIKIGGGTVNIYGGAVIGGTTTSSSQNGVAIRVNAAATLNVEGGTITGGNGGNQGGAIGAYGTVNISGGTFIPGDVKEGKCIAIIKSAESDPAKLTISDCELSGDIYLNQYAGACDATLSGKVVINKGDKYGLYATGTDEIALDVSGLTEGSSISFSACGYFAKGANETIATYFRPEVDGDVILDGDKLLLGRKSCLCGNIDGKCISTVCDGTELLWKPWRSTSTLPTESGHWYLTSDVKGTASITAVANADVVLDLNGYTVNRGGRLISMYNITNTAYTITDTSTAQSGKIVLTGTSTNQGAIWATGSGNKLTLVRGTLDGSGRKLTANSGVVVAVSSGGTFDMHGGTILGGACEAAEGNTSQGGAVASSGTTNIYGGVITGGSSTQDGGNIRITGGTFTVYGGEITDGSAVNGGNINISGGKLVVKGGTISGGKATAHGGNIHQAGGTVELLGGTIENGTVTSTESNSGGGNLAANASGGVLTLNGVTMNNGSASQRGGNIYLYGKGIDMTVKGTTAITGGTANYGANICANAWQRTADDHAVITMDGGTVSDGYARANAGSVYLYESYDFILNDGTISGGTAKGAGGSIYLYNSASLPSKFIMNGGSITGGESGKDNTDGRNGGNVYVNPNATFELNGGSITDGKSNDIGGNIYSNGTLKITGGEISGGTAKSGSANAANVAVVNGKLIMTGGTVKGGVSVTNTKDDASTVELSGSPVIYGGTYDLSLVASTGVNRPVITVTGALSSSAKIGISSKNVDGVISDASAGKYASSFVSNDENRGIYMIDNAAEYPDEVGCLYVGKYGCVCGGEAAGSDCAKAGHPKVKWTAWTSTSSTPGSGTDGVAGNYYLTDSISVSSNQHYPKAGEFNIDLNGYNITSSSNRLFRLRNDSDANTDYALTIGITNTREVEDMGVISSTNTGAQEGYLVWMTQPSQVFNLYAGTLDGRKATTVESKSGGCVALSKGTFNMYGGEIKGGNATSGGGNVYITSAGSFNLKGGTVSGGTAKNGGSFSVSGALNISGGTVTGGNATSGGGNIMINNGGKVTLSGTGKIEKGTATSTGGNIHVASGGTFTMTGGTVTGGNSGGTATKDHENIYCKYGTLDLRGGTINGFVMVHNWNDESSTVKLSGNIQITGGTKDLTLAWGKDADSTAANNYPVIQLGQLTEGAKIGVSSGAELFAETSDNAIAVAAKEHFLSNVSGKQIVVTTEGLAFADASKIMRCICGGKAVGVGDHKCVDVEWTEWTAEDSLPTESGYYYLTKKVTTPRNDLKSGAEVYLDMNGFDITATDRLYCIHYVENHSSYTATSGYLSICNSKDTGIIYSDTSADQGGVFWVTTGTVELYDVTVDASKMVSANGAVGEFGNNNATATQGNLNMYGGKLIGGKTKAGKNGAAISLAGKMNMYGDATIIGGEAVVSYDSSTKKYSGGLGGAVYLNNANAVLTMNDDSVIDGGKAYTGGAVYMSSTGSQFIMNDNAVLKNGQTTKNNGGNLFVNNGVATINDNAQIFDGKSANISGNIQVASGGKMVMNGGKIYGGTVYYGNANSESTTAAHANMTLLNNATFIMNGGEIAGCINAFAYSTGANPNITISGSSKITGSTTNLNLNIDAGNLFSITVKDLNEDAVIGMSFVSKFVAGTTVVKGVEEERVKCIVADNASVTFAYDATAKTLTIN